MHCKQGLCQDKVSPYNLWTVRALRYLCVVFLAITFVWWVLLFVSIFISPPGMHSRGSGFFDVSFSTLTFFNLTSAILFFATPSKAMEYGSLILTFFLLIDAIIILAVTNVRHEEGWVGIAAAVWSTLMALFNVLTDRVVAWGKKEEEVRLTGRKETRRSLREWCAVFTATIVMVIMNIVAILLLATLCLRARDSGLEAPGKKYHVDGNKYQLHLNCIGNVTYNAAGDRLPTVLVEGASQPVEANLIKWISAAQINGTIPRYCYYDRPGLGWSDNAPSPHSAGMTANVLSEALVAAGEKDPWVLVSAGIGGIYSRIFSSRHLKQIAGIMLVDTLHEDLLSDIGEPKRGFLLWFRGFISPLGIDRLFGAIFQGRTVEDRVYGKSAWQGGKYIKAKLQENLVAASLTYDEIVQARNIQGDIDQTPLVVVSSGDMVKYEDGWKDRQRDLTTITQNLKSWDVVEGAPHEVWKTLEGRKMLEKRLGQLVRGGVNVTRVF